MMNKKTVTLTLFLIFSLILTSSVLAETTIISGNDFNNGVYNKTEFKVTGELDINDGLMDYSGLVAYYRMNNDFISDGYAYEEINNNNINIVGSPISQTGKLNDCVNISTSVNYFNDGDNNIIDSITDTLTINTWVKFDRLDLGDKTIISKYSSSLGRKFTLDVGTTGAYRIITSETGAYGDGTVSQLVISNNNEAVINEWAFISVVFDKDLNTTIYKNGIKIAEEVTTISSLYAESTAEYIIGCRDDLCGAGSGTMRGLIDEVTIWNRSLSSDEIQTLYDRQKDGYTNPTGLILTQNDSEQELSLNDEWFDTTNLVGYFKFNNDSMYNDSLQSNSIFSTTGTPSELKNAKLNEGINTASTATDKLFILNTDIPNKYNSMWNYGTVNIWVSLDSLYRQSIFRNYASTSSNLGLSLGSSNQIVFLSNRGSLGINCQGSAPAPITLNEWTMLSANWDADTGRSIIYINGNIEENCTYNGQNTVWESQGGILYAGSAEGSFYSSPNHFDELTYWNRSLSSDEIQTLYNRQSGQFINQGSYKSQQFNETISSISYEGINNSGTTSIYQDGTFFYLDLTGNSTDTPVVFNVSVNTASETSYTSIKHFDISVDDLTFDSATPIILSQVYINASRVLQAYSRASFNTIKASHPATTNLYMKETTNGDIQFDEIVRSLSLNSGWGIGNKPITSHIMNIGTNNKTIEVYEDSQGSVTIQNFEMHNMANLSNKGSEIDMDLITISFNYSSTSYEPVYNFSFNKSVSSYSMLDLTQTFSASGEDTPNCYIDDTSSSDVYGSHLPSEGVSRSSGVGHLFAINTTDEAFTLYCKSLDGETIYNDVTILMFADTDIAGNKIGTFGNSENNITLSAGTYQVMNLTNYEVKGDGDKLETLITNVFSSLSGEQVVELYITMNEFESPHMFRQLSDNTDLATSKAYSDFSFTQGDIVNSSMVVVVQSGESINIKTASGFLYESSTLNTTQGNTAPVTTISSPFNGDNVSGINQQINFTVADLNGNLDYCNITLHNSDGSLNTLLDSDATSPVLINWTDYNFDTDYIIKSSCIDTMGLTGYNNITVTNKIGSMSNIIIYDYPTSVSQNNKFNLTIDYTCDGFGCIDVSRVLDMSSPNCVLQDGEVVTKSLGNFLTGETKTETISYVCTIVESISLNISVNSSTSVTLSDVVSISVTQTNLLTPEQTSCIFTGKYVNGTYCAIGEANKELNMLGIIFGYFVVILFFIFVGLYSKPDPLDTDDEIEQKDNSYNSEGIRSFFFGIAFLQIVFLVFSMYAEYVAGDITNILFINFWTMLIIGFGALFVTVFKLAKYIWSPVDAIEDEEEKKW